MRRPIKRIAVAMALSVTLTSCYGFGEELLIFGGLEGTVNCLSSDMCRTVLFDSILSDIAEQQHHETCQSIADLGMDHYYSPYGGGWSCR